MSFSTPSMNPEVPSTATTHQCVMMPRINSPFNAYNLQQTALAGPLAAVPPKVFPSAHMPSPWNTAQYMEAVPSTQKATAWGSSLLPPVDIEVLAESSPTTQENTKISWTSAEQLADAIFPTDANNMGHSLEPLHHGLLNHKMEIEKLHNTAEPVHHGLLNHKLEIEKLHNTAERLSSILEKQQRCTSNHQMLHSAHEAKYASMKSTLKDTQESATASNILSKNNSTTLNKHAEIFETMKEHQKEQFAGLVNHRDTLRSLQETQTNLKVKAEKHDKSLQSMQRSLTEIQNTLQQQHMTPQRLEDLHQRAQSLERNIQAQNSQMNSLVSANNAINSNLECLQKQALSDRQVQFQVLAPRRK
jgi:hypothetical protein